MPTQLNDDFLERIALNLGENGSTGAAKLLETLQPTTDILEFNRTLLTIRDGYVPGGALTVGEVDFATPSDRDVLWIAASIANSTGVVINTAISIAASPFSSKLNQFVGEGRTPDSQTTMIIGDNVQLSTAVGDNQPVRKVRIPAGHVLKLRFTVDGGGNIPTGNIIWEVTGVLMPATKQWVNALALQDLTVVP